MADLPHHAASIAAVTSARSLQLFVRALCREGEGGRGEPAAPLGGCAILDRSWRIALQSARDSDAPACLDGPSLLPCIVQVDFDSYFNDTTTPTAPISDTIGWPNEFSFGYETEHVHALSSKTLTLKLYKSGWMGGGLIGECTVDLLTIATGPVEHRLMARDGSVMRCELHFKVTMEQQSDLELVLQEAELSAPSGFSPSMALSYAIVGASGEPLGRKHTEAAGMREWHMTQMLKHRVTRSALMASQLHLEIVDMSNGRTVAQSMFPLSGLPAAAVGNGTFLDTLSLRFRGAGSSGSWEMGCTLCAKNVPVWAQMIGGFHDMAGIHNARFASSGIPSTRRPAIALFDCYGGPAGPAPAPSGYGASSPYGAPAAPSGYGAPAAAALGAGFGSFYGSSGGGAYGAPAGIGGFGAPAPRPPVPAAAPSAPYGGPAFGLPGAGAGPASILPYGGAAPSAHAQHSRSQGSAGALAALLPTGGAHAPARSSGSSGASSAPKALPWFWDKKTDASSGRTYYVNHITHTTAWTLPTEDTYHVDIVAPGPLGVSLERCYHGMTRFAGPSGRRNSGADTGAVVKSVEPGSAIDRASSGRVQMGHHLIAVNGATTLTWDLSATCSMIQRASRPVRLTFQDPYAV
ncbi:dwwA [Symbiodinium sp. KB8]|nr:dwwA [Symbiodinium sp. KB8]